MPTTRRATLYYPILAKEYVGKIKIIRSLLREKRSEYNLAEFKRSHGRATQADVNRKKAEFDNIWQTQWPYYNGVDRVVYSQTAKPYPPDGVIQKIGFRERWAIISTALLAQRGVDKRRRLEGLVPKINGAADVNEFKMAIDKYTNPIRYENPPSYPRGSSAEEEEGAEWEEYVDNDVRQETPPADPFFGQRPRYTRRRDRSYADMPPEGSPGLITPGMVEPPKYSSPDYTLERGGRKTRKHKHSKHKHSKHKHSKHKHSKHKHSKHSKTHKKHSKTHKKHSKTHKK